MLFDELMILSKNLSFEESLVTGVIEPGKCLACNTCIVICPFKCLECKENPSLVKECKVCGICAQTCIQYKWSWSKAENFIFGRDRNFDEKFGIYRRLAMAQAKDDKILQFCQDGGVVTTLLLFALDNGLIDSAIVSGVSQKKPFYPTPKLVTTPEELLECAGTKYFYSPNILALAEGAKQKKKRMAFVGTPCQIRAVRKMQMLGLKKYTSPLKYLIGLMCSECFTYRGLMKEYIHNKLGINLSSIMKMNIKGKMLVTTDSGVKTIPLAEIKQYARKNCSFCDDFSAELADISTGGLGLDDWTFTIIRTEEGEELFSNAEKAGIRTRKVKKEEKALNLLSKLSMRKKKSFRSK